jgi:hypothetical protein
MPGNKAPSGGIFFWSAAIYRRFCFCFPFFHHSLTNSVASLFITRARKKKKTKAVMNHRTPNPETKKR